MSVQRKITQSRRVHIIQNSASLRLCVILLHIQLGLSLVTLIKYSSSYNLELQPNSPPSAGYVCPSYNLSLIFLIF